MHRGPRGARGAALPVGLLMLLAMTLLALAGTRLGALELRMAINDEHQVQAWQHAQSLVDGIVLALADSAVPPDPADACLREDTTTFGGLCAGTARRRLEIDAAARPPAGHYNARLARQPAHRSPPPPGSGFSADRFDAVQLTVAAEFDGTDLGYGRARVDEGLAFVQARSGNVPAFRDTGP